ncbi:3-hydroxyacyl-CoA dehydrogenase [Achromobacter sp. ACM04]|jgi:3-hydroxybutyryl-CoA dehydrogenase|uniref:3-hydroxyacyl-CoA dehydrogenase n=1 Tax=Achromobacter aegrifaciens TaxID=1287736 RepID=A0AAD2J0N0_ACHAE|nr:MULTISPECIES: 3-hydroxyacyl-CoA dehydrogenase [Achromobacter]PTN50961.1 3-hydroxyacyl-CoA dehydrogenase [Achromobacter xylosoxidans]MBD9422738.1 3-hydroxyacyl-CoA dehydrogenase [Achromobacter sp. ACM04]MBD9430184.1 3-hydroxyacyl-CoA dehydrogenase [Achromobacter sp. ACM03]MBD9471718.1 3-hydroxyacyl-CoA dehydrogenase [Achromobacter sp. ACM01]MDQ1761032.1 3-hydroxyacyl-CoA dehydrogenase [Achromobacter aegrifaciens]
MKEIQTIGVVGAGAMGRGIAQIAAQAGLRVRLYDTSADAVAAARESLRQTWDKLAQKGKLSAADAQAALERVESATALTDMSNCQLVVEAIVERLDVKRDLFAALEGVVAEDCILASNTSSLSITAIAAACKRPQRVAGYHFFNPVALMKVVEVIDGLRSAPEVGDALAELARRMGHTPVRAKDMPGFIVNHAGRGMNTEGLRVAQEAVATFAQVDAVMREQAGFRMGPFELLDLTALDVSHPVMESIYRQFFDEPRFRPSPITTVRLAGGLIGRKAGEGFYVYADGQKQVPAEPPVPALPENLKVWVSPKHGEGYARAAALVEKLGATLVTGSTPDADALILVTPYGEDVSTTVSAQGLNAARTVGLDTLYAFDSAKRRTIMVSPATEAKWRDAAHALLAADGVPVTVIEDSPGFIAQRIVATIVNIASDIAQQQIATPKDIDLAVTLGLGYPVGPLALGDKLGADRILEILKSMQRVTGDPRYRPSLWLQRRVQLGMSLTKAAGEE